MEYRASLSCPQKFASGPCHEPHERGLQISHYFMIQYNIIFLSRFPTPTWRFLE